MILTNGYCVNCGIKIKIQSQKFCENCGVELVETEIAVDQKNREIVLNFKNNSKNLFDLTQDIYVLKDDYWKSGSGHIYNSIDQIIGTINGIKKKEVELIDANGEITSKIRFKSGSMRGASELIDNEGNLIARLKKKKITTFNSIYYLEDITGTNRFEAEGEFINYTFSIKDLSLNKIVAECNKTEKYKDMLKGRFDHKNTYALRILDKQSDRRILLLFIIGIRQIRSLRMF
jgi:uncharacterized protein YxjI